MRFAKKRGKMPARLTLTETEVIEACYQYAQKQGHKVGKISWVKIVNPHPEKRTRMEVSIELT